MECGQLQFTCMCTILRHLFFTMSKRIYLILSLHSIYLITLATSNFANADYSWLIGYHS